MIDIKGIDKAKLLAALFNNSKQQGMGFMDERGRENMSLVHARSLIKELHKSSYGLYFDYLYGRVLKVDLNGDEMREDLYDRDVGIGEAQRVIDKLRA